MASAPLPLTYADAVCTDDLDPNGNETTSDLQNLAQDIYHILLEAPGSNLDDPARGIGVEGLLSGTSLTLTQAASVIDSQLRKDDRIDSSTTTLTLDAGGTYQLTILVTVDATVLPLGYTFSQQGGLVPSQ